MACKHGPNGPHDQCDCPPRAGTGKYAMLVVGDPVHVSQGTAHGCFRAVVDHFNSGGQPYVMAIDGSSIGPKYLHGQEAVRIEWADLNESQQRRVKEWAANTATDQPGPGGITPRLRSQHIANGIDPM